jgi:endonuclease I
VRQGSIAWCFVSSWVFLTQPPASQCDPPSGYYALAEAKSGADLRQALHQVVRNHRVIPYSSTRFDTSDALKVLDQDPANTSKVIGIYSRLSEPAVSFGLAAGWNREHLWCDSYGLDGREPAYSDLHNLRAEDATVNSVRGNKFFDVSDTNNPSYRLPAHAESPLASMDTDSWEPPAIVKGDIARAMFYMTIRYTGDVADEPALYLTESTNHITSTTNLMGRFNTLIKWHLDDPVDATEQLRNDQVYSYQTNRNPFIDHPAWVLSAFIPPVSITRQGPSVNSPDTWFRRPWPWTAGRLRGGPTNPRACSNCIDLGLQLNGKNQKIAHYVSAIYALFAQEFHDAQPHCRLAHVPVFRCGWSPQPVAPSALQHLGARRRGFGGGRGHGG